MIINGESSSWSSKKVWPCDPHFRELYYKIDKLAKEGYSQEEILKMKL